MQTTEPPKPKILVVDDRPENLLAAEAVLAPLKAEVVSVTSGAEALRRLLREDFAVVLMDVEMPELDGLETAALIRARPRTAALPILFITAEAQDGSHVMRGYAQGAVDYLQKPVDPEILRAKVSFFVELYVRGELIRRQERELAERRRAEIEAMRAAEFEKQLVAIVGHDIRGPLSAIVATAQVQLRRAELAEPQRRAFERIERSTARIQDIVGVLMDFTRARIGRGIPVERTPTCIAELVRRAVDEFEVIHPDRRIQLESEHRTILGNWDGARLSQVISNLLGNACKYSPEGSVIRVRITLHGDDVSFEVHNRGDPIPEEKLATLFEPFARGSDGSDGHARTSLGLGLFIVREIVRAHDGTIEVSSTANDGTRFRVTLPRGLSARRNDMTGAASGNTGGESAREGQL